MTPKPVQVHLELPDHDSTTVPCESRKTILDLKKIICQHCPGLGGHKHIRLLQKGMELHDQATLEYCHVTDNAMIKVIKRHHQAGEGGSPKPGGPSHLYPGPSSASASASAASPHQQRHQTAAMRNRPGVAPLDPQKGLDAGGGLASSASSTAHRSRPASAHTHRPPSSGSSTAGGAFSRRSQSGGTGTLLNESRSNDPNGSLLDDDPLGDALLRRIAKGASALERELDDTDYQQLPRLPGEGGGVGSSRSGSAGVGGGSRETELLRRRVETLEKQLAASEERNQRALERIQQLEGSVQRYTALMRKVQGMGL